MRYPELTHLGWFGICPVYLDALSACPTLQPRHWALWPVMVLSMGIIRAAITVNSLIDPDYDPEWPIMVTGKR